VALPFDRGSLLYHRMTASLLTHMASIPCDLAACRADFRMWPTSADLRGAPKLSAILRCYRRAWSNGRHSRR
jgi:hypothetical protein